MNIWQMVEAVICVVKWTKITQILYFGIFADL